MSCAFVARTVQEEPASPGVRVEPVTVHVPSMICHVTAPVPLPPDDVKDRVDPYVAVVDETVSAAWAALLMVTAVSAEFTAL